ncbi:hypothetical protein MAR_024724, partial [Mya arenaria]
VMIFEGISDTLSCFVGVRQEGYVAPFFFSLTRKNIKKAIFYNKIDLNLILPFDIRIDLFDNSVEPIFQMDVIFWDFELMMSKK